MTVKRISLRFNLEKEKSRTAWETLHAVEQFGYTSMQTFILDAVCSYQASLKSGYIPYSRGELEEAVKTWMREVLAEQKMTERENSGQKGQEKPPETVLSEEEEIDSRVFDLANDFLSTL